MTPSCPGAAPTKRGDTRKKMLISAAEVMRERGAAGVTIDEVLARSGAPAARCTTTFPRAAIRFWSRRCGTPATPSPKSSTTPRTGAPGSWCASSSSTGETPAVRRRLQRRVPRRRRRARVGRRRTPTLFRRRRHPGQLVYRADPGVRLRWLQRGGCGVAVGDVDRGLGGRDHAVPLDPKRGPAAPGRRTTRIPHQGKGIRRPPQRFRSRRNGSAAKSNP